jgi:photosystem I subunit 2
MTLNLQTPFPTFGGSTGGWLRAAEVEEKYAITWTSPKEQIFEMPTGGAAIMRNGENLLYLARKEQCLALGTQLRTFIEFSQVVRFNIYIQKMGYSLKK